MRTKGEELESLPLMPIWDMKVEKMMNIWITIEWWEESQWDGFNQQLLLSVVKEMHLLPQQGQQLVKDSLVAVGPTKYFKHEGQQLLACNSAQSVYGTNQAYSKLLPSLLVDAPTMPVEACLLKEGLLELDFPNNDRPLLH